MVNTLRKKKGKESPVIVDSNGSATHNSSSASTLASAPAQTAQQVMAPAEEKNRAVPAPAKVCSTLYISHCSFKDPVHHLVILISNCKKTSVNLNPRSLLSRACIRIFYISSTNTVAFWARLWFFFFSIFVLWSLLFFYWFVNKVCSCFLSCIYCSFCNYLVIPRQLSQTNLLGCNLSELTGATCCGWMKIATHTLALNGSFTTKLCLFYSPLMVGSKTMIIQAFLNPSSYFRASWCHLFYCIDPFHWVSAFAVVVPGRSYGGPWGTGSGYIQRPGAGHPEVQQRLYPVFQWLQHTDQHTLLLRGHHSITR